MQESVNIWLHAGKNQRGKHESKEDRQNLYKKGLWKTQRESERKQEKKIWKQEALGKELKLLAKEL